MKYHDGAVEMGVSHAEHFAEKMLVRLLRELRIEREDAEWRNKLAPFAPVWAAMIAAASAGHRTIFEGEDVEDARPGTAE